MNTHPPHCIAYAGHRCIAFGPLGEVALTVKHATDADPAARLLVFDAQSSEPVEIDCRGTDDDVLQRIARLAQAQTDDALQLQSAPPAGPGRPKLGVVAREITLLPRHWDWLRSQPGGASVTLRKLVEQARRAGLANDRLRQSQEAAYRFMNAIAGDFAGFEDATRALFAADRARFDALIAAWPEDIKTHLARLSEPAFETA